MEDTQRVSYLYFNGRDSGLTVKQFGVNQSDSINKFLPTGTIKVNDSTGNLNNFYAFAGGQELELHTVIDDVHYTSPFIVTNEALVSVGQQLALTGTHEMSIVHPLRKFESKQGRAFNDTTSGIVRRLMEELPFAFKSIDTESTADQGRWYCPGMTESEFITKLLIPSMYGGEAKGTPFYCFITCNNEVKVKSWQSLWNQQTEFVFKLEYPSTITDDGKLPIFNFNPLQFGYEASIEAINQMQFGLDREGNYTSNMFVDELNPSFKKNILAGLPVNCPTDVVRSHVELLAHDIEANNTDAINGALDVNNLRPLLTQEKVMVTVPMSPNLVSGKKIRIEIPSQVNDQTDFIRYTGDYLLETCYRQVGNGVGICTCILSRPGKNIPESVLTKYNFAFNQ